MNYCTAVAAGVTTFIANEVAKCMFVPLKPHIDYIRNRNKNLEEFKKKIELLKDERGRVKNAVDAAERNGEKIEEGVNKWLISVDEKINDEAEKVKALEDKAKKRCFIGLCPNLKSYYQLGKKVEEDARVVAELLEQGKFDGVSFPLALEGIGTMPVKDYEAFESRASTLAGIMEAIRDPKVRMIGVHGMAGVGKTTLVKEVARKVREESLFDEVVMATISHNPNIRNIQGEIADTLGLRFEQEGESGRAMRLRQCFELRSDKKILVILDDIWEIFDLEAIGIWFEEDGNRAIDEKQGAMMQNVGRSSFNKFSTVRKILLTSRSQDVLGHMKSERKFEIRILSQEEAMALFTKIVGDTAEKPDFRSIAKQVVDKTDGLPVAISVIAKALKDKGLDIWEDALRQLGRPTPTNIKGMQKGVYSIIELSYNSLESEEAQSLLQLCSWRPLGTRIYVPYLLRSSLGLDLLGDVKTLKEARNSLNTLLDKLKASGLLHEGDSNGYVKMHDLVRKVCILITSEDEQIVTEEADLKELLERPKLKTCKGINLVCSEIHELPDTLECPKLKFLAMWSEEPLSEVSGNFFIEMKELKVLQLGGMCFSSLPKSFLSLTNLQTLFLDDCKLHDIAIIGELKKLDILTLNSSRIEQLPREIGQLTHLRLLDLTDCSKLVVIPENVISSLTCLEELYMGNSFDRWDVEGNARLAELKDLCHLTTLDVQIRDAQNLRGDLLSGKLKRYKIFLGDGWDWSHEHGYSRTLKLKLNTSFNLDDGITMLLKNTEDLYVDELKGVSSVLYELDKTGFPDLKSLHVQNNSEIQCIINSSDRIAFPTLESLFLHSLVNLKKICAEVDRGSFAGLRIVKVGNCNTLENLFSFSLAITLSQLQEIEVIDCTKVIGIVTAEREQSNKASNQFGLRQLRSLTLQRLPELISFCSEEKRHSTSQPGLINTRSLPLFTEKMLFPCLENLRLSSMNIESIWHNQLFKLSSSIQNLTSLLIENCDNLKHLLSSTMARSLVNLKSFEIIKCKSLREIICTEDTEDDKATISFPQLNSLKLKDLQYLIGFCSETHIVEFPTLKLLEIDNCLELKGFMYKSTIQEHFSTQAFFNEKVAFPCLEKMTISRLRKMKIIWHNQLFVNSFSKLEEVTVEHCNELLTFFPSNLLGTFQRLHTLTVSNCGSLEQVFELLTLSMEKTHVVASKLRELNISRLPRLRYIWCTKDPQGIFTFENLRILDVDNCRSLKNVFPASVARVLPQLKDLRVAYCGVEEIISKDEGLETAITFEFDQVSSLILWDLPKLKCFYPGMHKTTWRMLKELKAYHCNKLKIFGTERLNLRDMNEDGHLFESPIQPPLFSVEKVIPKLEELALDGNDIEVMCDTQASRSLFHEIKALSVHCYHDEYAIFPITFLERFYNLEWLEVICCNFKELFSYKGDVNEEIQVGTYSRIRKLKLAFLHNLQYLWGKDSRISHILPNLENLEVLSCDNLITLGLFSASFTNLKILDVWGCYALINLVASSAAQSLVHLEKMVVTECVSVKEIVGNEGDEQTYNITFAKLKCLELQHLPNLTSFSSSNHTFEFPSLEEVIVSQCPELKIFSRGNLNVPMLRRVQVKGQDYKVCWHGDLNSTIQQLYTEKVGYQGMVYLVLSKFSMSREIWSHNLQRNLDFKSLKLLRVYDCHGLKFIFTVSMALDLLQLEEVTVKNCPAMEQIIINDGVEQRAVTDTIMFPWLKFITLESCTNLTSFLRGSNTMECPLLKQIIMADCPKMIAFASTFLREQDIETVGEGNLTMLGTAQFFSDQVVFPKLEKLRLSSIEEINKIWHEQLPGISSYAQNLTSLDLKDCHDLKRIFGYSMVEFLVQLKELFIANCKNVEEVISVDGLAEAESLSQILCFPKLEILVLDDLPKLRRFCYGNYFEFPFLIGFRIKKCSALKTFISGFAIENETQIAQRGVEDNGTAVDDSLSLFNEKVAFPSIERLTIIGGGSWRNICHDQFHRDSFCKLNLLWVHDCDRLLYVFPFDMRGRLEKLEEMGISCCDSLEEIFEPPGLNVSELQAVTTNQSVRFVFPNLQILRLSMLPKLKSFCSRIHTAEWPSLKKMRVYGCDKVEIFASENLNFGETSINQQSLFWVNEVTFPNLEELELEWNDTMKEIWHGQLPEKFFCKLKVLKLVFFLEESAALPHCFIQSFPNLEKLVVKCAPFNHIFQCEGHGDEERHGLAMTQLIKLKLIKLPELAHIWKEEFQPRAAFFNLRTLEVKECGKLKNLVPSSVSFANLTTLEVSKCHGLINLISSSTAKSLMQLTKMSVIDCLMIEEIIACNGDGGGIVFTQLKFLQLSRLPSLASFCLEAHIFEFPALEKLVVKECPNMETFCQGDLRTPKLHQVHLTDDDEDEENVRWEGNLQTTIQKLFDEMQKGTGGQFPLLDPSNDEHLRLVIIRLFRRMCRMEREFQVFRENTNTNNDKIGHWKWISLFLVGVIVIILFLVCVIVMLLLRMK